MTPHPLCPNLGPEDLAALNNDVASCESRVLVARKEVDTLQTQLDDARHVHDRIPTRGEDKARALAACDTLMLKLLDAHNREADATRDLQHAKVLAAGLARFKARREQGA